MKRELENEQREDLIPRCRLPNFRLRSDDAYLTMGHESAVAELETERAFIFISTND